MSIGDFCRTTEFINERFIKLNFVYILSQILTLVVNALAFEIVWCVVIGFYSIYNNN